MIQTEFQKLVRSIHERLRDDYFLKGLRDILRTGVADVASLISKLRDIRNNLTCPETACDKIIEVKAASQFRLVRDLKGISFGENPDLRIEIGSQSLSVEVKRFRLRPEDATDSVALKNRGGDLVVYGTPEKVQLQIEDVLLKKCRNHTGQAPFFIYLWSDSPYQVEDSEIKCAARAIRSRLSGRLLGVFYKWAAYERNLILLESSPMAQEIERLLKHRFSILR